MMGKTSKYEIRLKPQDEADAVADFKSSMAVPSSDFREAFSDNTADIIKSSLFLVNEAHPSNASYIQRFECLGQDSNFVVLEFLAIYNNGDGLIDFILDSEKDFY